MLEKTMEMLPALRCPGLKELALGGTAVGTGPELLPKGFDDGGCKGRLRGLTGKTLSPHPTSSMR